MPVYSPYFLAGMALTAFIGIMCNQINSVKSPTVLEKRLVLPDFSNEVYYYATSIKALTPDQNGLVTLKSATASVETQVMIDSVRVLDTNEDWEDETFPKAVFDFKNLRLLSVGMRGFKTFPTGISQLKQLEEIDFQHGSIEKLPNDFCQLRNLRSAIFLFSNLKELPECIGDLEKLEYLHLSFTHITRFPESMKNLKKLKMILIQQSPDEPHIAESEYLKLKSWLPKCGIHYELRNPD